MKIIKGMFICIGLFMGIWVANLTYKIYDFEHPKLSGKPLNHVPLMYGKIDNE